MQAGDEADDDVGSEVGDDDVRVWSTRETRCAPLDAHAVGNAVAFDVLARRAHGNGIDVAGVDAGCAEQRGGNGQDPRPRSDVGDASTSQVQLLQVDQ